MNRDDGRQAAVDRNVDGEELPSAAFHTSADACRIQRLRDEVLDQLRTVIDPDLHKDIVALGFVRDLEIHEHAGSVKFRLRLTTPACPVKDVFVATCTARLRALEWVHQVDIQLESQKPSGSTASRSAGDGLKCVSFVLAVTSCKGGVGKSTVAVNLAFMLRRLGAKVGLLDADLYGPSLPVLLPLPDTDVYFEEESEGEPSEEHTSEVVFRPKRSKDRGHSRANSSRGSPIAFEPTRSQRGETDTKKKHSAGDQDVENAQPKLRPLVHNGVKIMSYGFIRNSGSQGFSALRGPFASSVIEQLLTGTAWRDLDYLVIDFPPGTGDIHITLSQTVKIDACVVVTTPQTLSTADAERGIKMFNELGIPTICVVENMAHFVCDGCQKKHILFPGQQNVEKLADLAEAPHVVQIPLDPRLSEVVGDEASAGDQPTKNAQSAGETCTFPVVERLRQVPEDKVYSVFHDLAAIVVRELSTLRYGYVGPSVTLTGDSCVQIGLPRRIHRTRADDSEKRWTSSTGDPDDDHVAAAGKASTSDPHAVSIDVCTVSLRRLRDACECGICTEEAEKVPKSGTRATSPAELALTEVLHASNRSLIFVWDDDHRTALPLQTLERLAHAEDEIRSRASGSVCTAGAQPELEW
ncbi:atp-binding protein, Mrp/Nbp35 family, related [Neospora caninum Liverpool]|uniref:ATP-binding protein, Mrp/Nbp35 family, related n=1 Tax=Neospora caninum (strain Liverpool) TaxID=572307 RepID=F0VAD8_NEOCL|nr:atp-binding protein, Mrp/Nbp35 family, related [Neospora caninum Liverpool]CBZ50627.1 atp-binding protein, Mrp/Nbp35 family, related [Neospora caninum Liverpool]CEL65239.1 TPA: ATP-binding protein, Mrp/Nbp35 family, related [Neospora caninum Liverpool]|eukprot:XP_003880660.1 atp-binding protein, Mrp/Nbp35 family, related [Neospora caninum Liverpool]